MLRNLAINVGCRTLQLSCRAPWTARRKSSHVASNRSLTCLLTFYPDRRPVSLTEWLKQVLITCCMCWVATHDWFWVLSINMSMHIQDTYLCQRTENRARKTNVLENVQVRYLLLVLYEPLPITVLTSLTTNGVGWGGLLTSFLLTTSKYVASFSNHLHAVRRGGVGWGGVRQLAATLISSFQTATTLSALVTQLATTWLTLAIQLATTLLSSRSFHKKMLFSDPAKTIRRKWAVTVAKRENTQILVSIFLAVFHERNSRFATMPYSFKEKNHNVLLRATVSGPAGYLCMSIMHYNIL